MEAALKAIKTEDMSIRIAAERFQIAKSTLHDHLSGKSERTGAGRPTVLTELEEKVIARTCAVVAQYGFGLDRFIASNLICKYLASEGKESPFKDGVPGKKWWANFLRRWPSLSERKPQHFPKSRAEASTPEVMDMYFEHLKVTMHALGSETRLYAYFTATNFDKYHYHS